MLNITKEGIAKAQEDRNTVLSAMGFEEEITSTEVSEAPVEASVSEKEPTMWDKEKYGAITETEIADGVFEISCENHSAYEKDLKTKRQGYFIGQ